MNEDPNPDADHAFRADLDLEDAVLSHDELLARCAGPTQWTVEGFMERRAYAVLAADPKKGKTALATHLAYCVAQGLPFVGKPTTQAPVLWLGYEESIGERRFLMDGYPKADVLTKLDAKPMDSEAGVAQIRRLVERYRPGLVVIDPLMAAVSADSMSEARKARVAMTGINDIRRQYDTSFLVLHHMRKGHGRKGDHGRVADSHQILASASQSWVMEARPGSPRLIELHGEGRGEHANRVLRIESDDAWTYREAVEGTTRGRASQAGRVVSAKDRFVASLADRPEGMTAQQIAEAAGLNPDYTKNLGTKLAKANKVEILDVTAKTYVYVLPRVEGEEQDRSSLN